MEINYIEMEKQYTEMNILYDELIESLSHYKLLRIKPKQQYELYTVETYKINFTSSEPTLTTTDIKDVIETLKTNNAYHLKLKDETFEYKFYLDLDHIPNKEYIPTFISYFAFDIFNIDTEDIKYTESIKQDGSYSYHLVIPKIRATKAIMKTMIIKIKEKKNINYYQTFDETLDISSYIDDGVYNINNLFRLPNQTNNEKPIPHTIINGKIEDFIFNYINENSTILKLNKQELKKQQTKKNKELKQQERKSITFLKDDQLTKLLNDLDPSYLDDYKKWIIITNIFKGIDKYKLWDDWSKQSDRYNRFKNLNIWKNTKKIKFNVNYLINITNTTGIFKEYIQLTTETPTIKFNNKYISNKDINGAELSEFDKINILDYKTIIIKSCTGTGKTTGVAKALKGVTNLKVLSITSRITLGDQIENSFKKEKIKIKNYKNDKYDDGDNFIVCINSLTKFIPPEMEDLEEYIIYIDEINSFLQHLMSLDKCNAQLIFRNLMNYINNCKLLILSDAVISDGVFEFINKRKGNKIFFENEYKKFEGRPAIRINDEEAFKNKIDSRIKKDKYFLFGLDSLKTGQLFYNDFITKYPEKKNKFLLIDSEHPLKIKDASKAFKNKFVFYSPSITTAVDFSIDTAQDVFIYIKGNTITPADSFQQTTRTRNIRKLYYYAARENAEEQYTSLEDCKSLFLTLTTTNDKLNNVCSYLDENNEIKIVESTFFNLFCYYEYVKDIYQINKLKHFQLILEANKFILQERGERNRLDKGLLQELTDNINEEEWKEFMNNTTDIKFKVIQERVKILNLPNDLEIFRQCKNILTDKYQLSAYFDTIKFFKSDEYIQNKIKAAREKQFSVKWMNNIYTKINIFRKFEAKYELSLNYKGTDEEFNLPKDESDLYKKMFYFKFEPKTKADLKKVYISMIKHITSKDIIITNRIQTNKVRSNFFGFNQEQIRAMIDINKYTNTKLDNFDNKYHKLLNITIAPKEYNNLDEFTD